MRLFIYSSVLLGVVMSIPYRNYGFNRKILDRSCIYSLDLNYLTFGQSRHKVGDVIKRPCLYSKGYKTLKCIRHRQWEVISSTCSEEKGPSPKTLALAPTTPSCSEPHGQDFGYPDNVKMKEGQEKARYSLNDQVEFICRSSSNETRGRLKAICTGSEGWKIVVDTLDCKDILRMTKRPEIAQNEIALFVSLPLFVVLMVILAVIMLKFTIIVKKPTGTKSPASTELLQEYY